MSLYVVYHKHCKIVTRRHHRLKAINGAINATTAASVLITSGLAVFLPPVIAAGNGVIITIRMAIGRLGREIKTMLSSIKMRLRAGSKEGMSQTEKDTLLYIARGIDIAIEIRESETKWYRSKYDVPASDLDETLEAKYPCMLRRQVPS